MSNVYEFRTRPRRALTPKAALELLRRMSKDGPVVVEDSYPGLSAMLGWDRKRTWTQVDRWEKTDKVVVEKEGDVLKSITPLPDLTRGAGSGVARPQKVRRRVRKNVPNVDAPNVRNVDAVDVSKASSNGVLNSVLTGVLKVQNNESRSDTYVPPPDLTKPPEMASAIPPSGPENTSGNASVFGPEIPPGFTPQIPPKSAPAGEPTSTPIPKAPETTPPQPLRQPASHAVVHGGERVVWKYADGDGGGGYDRPPPMSFMDVLLLLVAISLAGVAAILSISGMRILFAGTPVIALSLGIALESAKLIATGWLGTRWGHLGWGHRLPLIGMVLGVALINAVSVYSQLVASHLAVAGAEQVAHERTDAEAAARLDLAQTRVNDLNRRIAQIDATVEGAAQKGRSKAAMDAMRAQQRQRADLVAERDKAQRELADLKTSRSAGSAKHQATINEALPIQYVAEFLGIHRGGEEVIRWLIAGIVAVTDPFALLLASALGARRRPRVA